MDRSDFFSWIWSQLTAHGLIGVHEGTLLSAEAAEQGLATDSWTVDSGCAPRERDWVSQQDDVLSELYFHSREGAEESLEILSEISGIKFPGGKAFVEEVEACDWDAQWKASFLASPEGVRVPPIWRVIPPWVSSSDLGEVREDEKILRVNPGAGFGTGTHETTQLCLEAIAEIDRNRSLEGEVALDFGSGSGILAIGAALLGARVDAVEIDPLAIDNARENAALNSVEKKIDFRQRLPTPPKSCRLVVANILKPVLLEFASELVSRMSPRASLVLSGLIEKDVEEVSEAFSSRMGGKPPRVRALNEWRALVWEECSS